MNKFDLRPANFDPLKIKANQVKEELGLNDQEAESSRRRKKDGDRYRFALYLTMDKVVFTHARTMWQFSADDRYAFLLTLGDNKVLIYSANIPVIDKDKY